LKWKDLGLEGSSDTERIEIDRELIVSYLNFTGLPANASQP
jgi:hypothetical protein